MVDSPGDNILAEFGSVVDAVECAVKFQEAIEDKNSQLPKDPDGVSDRGQSGRCYPR